MNRQFEKFTDLVEQKAIKMQLAGKSPSTGNPLFKSIEPTQLTEEKGKWFFLFHEEHTEEVHNFLDKEFSTFFDAVKVKGNFMMLDGFPVPQKGGKSGQERTKLNEYADDFSQSCPSWFAANSVTSQNSKSSWNRPPSNWNRRSSSSSTSVSYKGFRNKDSFPPLIQTRQVQQPNPWNRREPRNRTPWSQARQEVTDEESLTSAETTALSNTTSNAGLRRVDNRVDDLELQIAELKKQVEEQGNKIDRALNSFEQSQEVFKTMVQKQSKVIEHFENQASDRAVFMEQFTKFDAQFEQLQLQIATISGERRANTNTNEETGTAMEVESPQNSEESEWNHVQRNKSPSRSAGKTHQRSPQNTNSATRPSKYYRQEDETNENPYNILTQSEYISPTKKNGRRGVNHSVSFHEANNDNATAQRECPEPQQLTYDVDSANKTPGDVELELELE